MAGSAPRAMEFPSSITRRSGIVGAMSKMDCTDILKALADRSRMRIVKALLAEPRGVNELSEALDISQYNISKHLRILREAGIVEVEPDGTRREYFVAGEF